MRTGFPIWQTLIPAISRDQARNFQGALTEYNYEEEMDQGLVRSQGSDEVSEESDEPPLTGRTVHERYQQHLARRGLLTPELQLHLAEYQRDRVQSQLEGFTGASSSTVDEVD